MSRMKGKTALVTAAAQGIGRAIVEKFAAEGASIWATDINMDLLSELDGAANITIRELDVTDTEAVKACCSSLGGRRGRHSAPSRSRRATASRSSARTVAATVSPFARAIC